LNVNAIKSQSKNPKGVWASTSRLRLTKCTAYAPNSPPENLKAHRVPQSTDRKAQKAKDTIRGTEAVRKIAACEQPRQGEPW